MNNWDENANWDLIPDYMRQPLRDWIEKGWIPGSFLLAVLENNLFEAVACADMVNRNRLPDYIEFLYRYAPSECWGSYKKVNEWGARRYADPL